MNEETKKLRELIERATAAPDILSHDLDAETESLRRGWLQLGKLIEEETGICGVPARNGHARMPQPATRRTPAWPLWIAASAASLIVATGIALAVHFFGAHEPQKNLQQIAGRNEPPKRPAEPVVVPQPAPPQAAQPQPRVAESGNRLEWGDSVDDEIRAVGEATTYVKQDSLAQPRVWAIETGLDELKQEVEQGNL
jgi:hypothetical protein